MLKRLLAATTLGGIGLALLILSFVYDLTFAGLPYPDPIPEMQARWKTHQSIAHGGVVLGGLVLLAAAVRLVGALWRKLP